MAVWGWARLLPLLFGQEIMHEFPHLKRLLEAIGARPAAIRADGMKHRLSTEPKFDDEFRRNMFRFLDRE
jgi:GST-like protein